MRQDTQVRIVPMNADHLDEVAELERICFSAPWSRNMLAEELDNALSAFLVALDGDGKVVGYAGLQVILDEGYITNVAVRPDCRRRGIARELVGRMLALMAEKGVRSVLLEVRESNLPARNCYAQAGFTVVGRRKNYYEAPKEDALLMGRILE